MSTVTGRHPSSPPPDALRDLHRRLAAVLADLTFPAQRWQLIAAAECYGADTVTRTLLERAPEQRYATLTELVTVLGGVLGARALAAAGRSAPPHAARSGADTSRRVTRVAHPGPRPGAPRPAA